MIPILFSYNATSFNTHGIGDLTESIRCETVANAEGEYELELEYPAEGKYVNDLAISNIIVAKANDHDSYQAFRIYGLDKSINSLITVHAQHISYDLAGCIVNAYEAETCSAAISGLKTNKVGTLADAFTIITDIPNSQEAQNQERKFKIEEPATVRAALLDGDDSIKGCFGGDLVFDNYKVKLLQMAGSNRGVLIEYGIDLIDMTQEENISEMITGVYPYWRGRETREEGDPEDFSEEEKIVYGSVINATGNFKRPRIIPLNVTEYYPNNKKAPTPDEINQTARDWIKANEIGQPQISLTVSYAHLKKDIRLYDAITVRFVKIGVDVKAKVVSYKYDVLKERCVEIEVGNVKPSILFSLEDASRLKRGLIPPKRIGNNSIDGDKLANSSVGSSQIKDDTVSNWHLKDSAVTTSKILDESITTEKIGQWAITSSKIGDAEIISAKIKNGAITNEKIGEAAISSNKIGEGEVHGINLGNSSVTSAKIKDGEVIEAKLANGAVTTNKVADLAIDEMKIGNSAITSTKIKDGEVVNEKLANGSVTARTIKDGEVNEAKIGNSAITSIKIKDGEVINAKLADASVTTDKVADLAIDQTKIGNSAITSIKIKDGEVGKDKIANGAVVEVKLADAAVTTKKVADLAIDQTKIGNSAITSTKIKDGEVVTSKIHKAAITTEKVEDLAIDSTKIGNSAITSVKIQNGEVVEGKIGNEAIRYDNIKYAAIDQLALGEFSITSTQLDGDDVEGGYYRTCEPDGEDCETYKASLKTKHPTWSDAKIADQFEKDLKAGKVAGKQMWVAPSVVSFKIGDQEVADVKLSENANNAIAAIWNIDTLVAGTITSNATYGNHIDAGLLTCTYFDYRQPSWLYVQNVGSLVNHYVLIS